MTTSRNPILSDLFSADTTTVIPEVSGNHCGSLDRAKLIIDGAKDAGCKYIKFQTYEASSITLKSKKDDFLISDPSSLWHGEYLFDLYEKACSPFHWQKVLFEYSRDIGLIPFSSPFCEKSVEVLEEVDCPIYKIASFEANNLPLIKAICLTGKPIIMSTGTSDLSEIDKSIDFLIKNGISMDNLILMKCTSNYPADITAANVHQMKILEDRYKCLVGYSDHTIGLAACIAAAALGAVCVEKHFTLSHNDNNIDGAFSAGVTEMRQLVGLINNINLATKSDNINHWSFSPSQFKRSLYARQDIEKGDIITLQNLAVVRPSYGGDAYEIYNILGKPSPVAIKSGERFLYTSLNQ